MARSGGFPPFADARGNGEVAPIPVILVESEIAAGLDLG
jgi:hypothetical protein